MLKIPLSISLFLTYGIFVVDCQINNPDVCYDTFTNIKNVLNGIGDNDALKHLGDLVPKIAVIGVQSAGKSTFIESFVRIPMTFIDANTATRCPVEFVLRNDPVASTPKVYIRRTSTAQKEEINFKTLPDELQKIMESLGRSFSIDPVEVTVISKDVNNITFVDIPGLISNPKDDDQSKEEAKMVAYVAGHYARDKSYKIIAVLKASDDFSTNTDIAALHDRIFNSNDKNFKFPSRPSWRDDAVIIVNRVNQQLQSCTTAEDANRLLNVESSHQETFFVALKPDPNWKRERAGFDDVQRQLSVQDDEERKLFSDWKSNLTDKEKWNKDNDKHIGLNNARGSILKLFSSSIRTFIPAIESAVRELLDDVNEKLVDANSKVSAVDPGKVDKLLQDFIKDFIEHITKFQYEAPIEPHDKSLPDNRYNSTKFGRKLMDDVAGNAMQKLADDWNKDLKEPFFIDPETIAARFASVDKYNTFLSEWNMTLMGSAANRRLLNYFQYLLISRTMPNVSDSTIVSMGAHSSNGANSFDSSLIIISLARGAITNAEKGMDWFLRGLKGISDNGLDVVLTHLLRKTGKYSLLAKNAIIRSKMTAYYQSAVEKLLKRIQNRWEEDIHIFSSFISLDLPIKKIMSVLISPQEELIRPAVSYIMETDKDDDVLTLSKLPEIPQDRAPYQTTRRASGIFSSRFSTVHEIVIQIRKNIKEWQQGFGPMDYTNGGHVSTPNFERFQYDPAYLQSAATEYYIAVMDTIINNMDAAFNAFYDYEVAKGGNHFLSSETMLQGIRQQGNSSGLMAVLGVNYAELVEEQKKLQESRDKLLKVQFYLQEAVCVH